MYCIIGHYIDPYGYERDRDEIVALFSTEAKAKAYIKQSTLKSSTNHDRRKFKIRSLLAPYKYVSIEAYAQESYPIDPTL